MEPAYQARIKELEDQLATVKAEVLFASNDAWAAVCGQCHHTTATRRFDTSLLLLLLQAEAVRITDENLIQVRSLPSEDEKGAAPAPAGSLQPICQCCVLTLPTPDGLHCRVLSNDFFLLSKNARGLKKI